MVSLDTLIHAIKTVHSDALEQLTDAVLAAEHLGEVADHLIGHFVDQARRSGASWTDIGKSMGVTKQAAQKRFVPKADTDRAGPERGLRAVHPARPQRRGRRPERRPRRPATARSRPTTWCSACSATPSRWPSLLLAEQGVDTRGRPRGRRRCRRPTASRSELVPFNGAGQEGAGADLPRGASPRPQLHRHRAHAAGAAGVRGRRPARCTALGVDKDRAEAHLHTVLASLSEQGLIDHRRPGCAIMRHMRSLVRASGRGLLAAVTVAASARPPPPASAAGDAPIGNLGDTLRVESGGIVADVTVHDVLPTDPPPGYAPNGSPRWRNEGGPWRAEVTVHAVQAPNPYAMAVAFTFDGVTPYADAYASKHTDAPDALETALLNAPPGSTVAGAVYWQVYRELVSQRGSARPAVGSAPGPVEPVRPGRRYPDASWLSTSRLPQRLSSPSSPTSPHRPSRWPARRRRHADNIAAFVAANLSAGAVRRLHRRPATARCWSPATRRPRILGYAMLIRGVPDDPDVQRAVTARPAVELSKMYVLPDATAARCRRR